MAKGKIKIMEAGLTKNVDWWSGLPISISSKALDDIVRLGNEKPIHCRYTHEGMDMLSGYIGRFTNFSRDESAVYADFTASEAVRVSDGESAKKLKQIEAMLEHEPDMLGCSVVINQDGEPNESNTEYIVSGVSKFWAADMVGIPAATGSLYAQGADNRKVDENNNPINKDNMSLFSKFAALLSSNKQFAAVEVTAEDGSKLIIEKAGEDIAVGDTVKDAEGNTVADGDYTLVEGEEKVVLSVMGGAIVKVEKVETETEVSPVAASVAPEEDFAAMFAAEKGRADRLEKELNEFKAKQFSKAPTMKPETSAHSTALSEDQKKDIRKLFQ